MLTFIISAIALALISVTMLVRANDIGFRTGLNWNARRIGFILTGFAPVGVVLRELTTSNWPNIYEMTFRVGVALVFLTTPYLPPWWKWISGVTDTLVHPLDAARAAERSLLVRLRGVWARFIAWLKSDVTARKGSDDEDN